MQHGMLDAVVHRKDMKSYITRALRFHVLAVDHRIEHSVLHQKLAGLEAFWQLCRMVCSITRGPAKPISAPGSAMFRSPSMA